MKNSFVFYLCYILFFALLAFPVEAKVSIGLPSHLIPGLNQSELKHLENTLSQSMEDQVSFRDFSDEDSLNNWLLRFQELDAAIISERNLKQHPAGTLIHLAEIYTASSPKSPLKLVVRSSSNNQRSHRLANAILKLGDHGDGRKLLTLAGLAGTTRPGEQLTAKRTPQRQPVREKSKNIPTGKLKREVTRPKESAEIASSYVDSSKAQKGVKPLPDQVDVPSEPSNVKKHVKTKDAKLEQSQGEIRPAKTPAKSKPVSKNVQNISQDNVVSKEDNSLSAPEQKPQNKPNRRMIIFVILLIFCALLVKISLIILKLRQKRQASSAPPFNIPAHDQTEEAPSVSVNEKETEPERTGIIEVGTLGPGVVPTLLKRCADMPKPVVLKITKGNREKRLYFAGGQVAGANTQNISAQGAGLSWAKLANLLTREQLINEEARGQALSLINENPDMRFGEALLQLELIALSDLRHALTRQVKLTVFSSILFPEGDYEIIDENSLPAEESISLEITTLIREAAQHKSEWTAIRQTLPNLDKVLVFTEQGEEKIEGASLSNQQRETLSLIKGKRSINEICIESELLDYEVYRLLYLMVKADVLKN